MTEDSYRALDSTRSVLSHYPRTRYIVTVHLKAFLFLIVRKGNQPSDIYTTYARYV